MKNFYLKPFLMTGLMLPSLAMAGGLSANSMAQLSGMRAKQSLMNQKSQALGVSVSPASLRSIEDAVNTVHKRGGDATVDFGLKSGAVLIGSGAPGISPLVATSNISNGGSTILTPPPLVPKATLIVVGRPGIEQRSESNLDQACAFKVKTDAQGTIIPDKNFTEFRCADLGSPMYLMAGKYIIEYGTSRMVVDLGEMENKVIPLREVSVPNWGGKTGFTVERSDCSLVELAKYSTFLQAADLGSSKDRTMNNLVARKRANESWNCADYLLEGNSYKNDYRGSPRYLQGTDKIVRYGTEGSFFSVLPGAYTISWYVLGEDSYLANGSETGEFTVE